MTLECTTTTVQEQNMGCEYDVFLNHIAMHGHEHPEVHNASGNNGHIGKYQRLILSLMEAFPNTSMGG